MHCPNCNSPESRVVDKRSTEGGIATRRRRSCMKCKQRFTTYERAEGGTLTVIKRDGSRQPFDRNKITIGIAKACEKLPIGPEQIAKLTAIIEEDAREKHPYTIKASEIGKLVLQRLRRLDKVAYMRFASVYKGFPDLSSFEAELRALKK